MQQTLFLMIVLFLMVLPSKAQDPVEEVPKQDKEPVLKYSTYLGGSSLDDCDAIAVDGSGNAYLACHSNSANFPTANSVKYLNRGGFDAFVTKLNTKGSALVYTAHFGGSEWESGQGIAVDADGNAYVVGATYSSNFPTTEGAFQSTFGGEMDAFVIKLNPTGSVVYSSYLGGSGEDNASGIAVDGSGNVYVVGWTTSSNFPTTKGAFQTAYGGKGDVFVTKLNASGSVVYSTYLGGSSEDKAEDLGLGIAIDDTGNAYIAGGTESADFPTVRPFQAHNGGRIDAFVTKFNPTGSALVYSTYLGGRGKDGAGSIAVDNSGNAYVAGETFSSNFPTTKGAFQTAYGGKGDAFVTQFNPTGSALVYSTYLGGRNIEFGDGMAVDAAGNAYVGGATESEDFPTVRPWQARNRGGKDAYVAKLNSMGSGLVYSTQLGGRGPWELFEGIAVDPDGNTYVSGLTDSVDFPTVRPIQAAYGGGRFDVVVAKFSEESVVATVSAQETPQSEREAMYERYLEFASYVKGGSIEPHWLADGSSFWYADGAPTNTVVWKVDPKTNTKTPLFDTMRLRRALAAVLGHEPPYNRLPFEEFVFVKGETTVQFTLDNEQFALQLDTYAVTRVPATSKEEKSNRVPQIVVRGVHGQPDDKETRSPDGKWFTGVKEHNLWLRSTDGSHTQLTTDGIKDYEWDPLGYLYWDGLRLAWWSPDSSKIAVKKIDSRKVEKIPIVHWLTSPEKVEWVDFPRAGKPLPQAELFIIDIRSKKKIRVDTGNESDQEIRILGWSPDGSELLFRRADRLLKKLDLMAADPNTGEARVILSETQETFIPTWRRFFTQLEDGRFIWISERDGWNHLYLYGLDGTLLRRLSEGDWPVSRVVAVDEKSGWVYFTAHGDQQRPHDTHLYRVGLDGTGFSRLTEATGRHEVQFSPSKQFFLDTHSTVVRPPTVELRRADGTLLQNLSKANIDALVSELKWRPPEEFVVKAADGKTDLYGVLYKPYDFDPNRKYPVVEWIYTGRPVVPRTFTRQRGQARAQLGYITFLVDGRGIGERGKAFEDAVYRQPGRFEIDDHVVRLKQLAETRPYMDLTRVGVIGHSYGGYAVLRAMLLYPEVYHVGIASAPAAEPLYQLYDDFEPLLGLPQENKTAYEDASNVRLADNLQGKLLLVHGTSDVITPLSHTLRMAEALARAGKSFDMLIMPEQTHSFTHKPTRPYMFEATRRYFQEHLKP